MGRAQGQGIAVDSSRQGMGTPGVPALVHRPEVCSHASIIGQTIAVDATGQPNRTLSIQRLHRSGYRQPVAVCADEVISASPWRSRQRQSSRTV